MLSRFSKRQGDFDHEDYRGGPSQQHGLKQSYSWQPLFPFGHGLSKYRVAFWAWKRPAKTNMHLDAGYTSFNLSITGTSPPSIVQRHGEPEGIAVGSVAAPFSTTDSLNVSVSVANTGAMDGKTVVAVYFSKPLSSFVRYHKMLAVFAKTPLIKAGAATTVTLTMPIKKLSAFNIKEGEQWVESGEYTLTVGQDSTDIAGTFSITVA